MKKITYIGLLVLFVEAIQARVIDTESFPEIDRLCNNESYRISSVSAIPRLIEHFSQGKDGSCRNQWLRSLNDLQQMLDSGAHDACSYSAVDKIKRFHWTYIVGTLSKSWRKASLEPIPAPLKFFFLHYAIQVANQCKTKLTNRLNEAVSRTKSLEDRSSDDGSFGILISTISIGLVPQASVKKFEDFFLIFDSLIAAERKRGKHLLEEYDVQTGEQVYISLKVRNATRPQNIQEKCRAELRPVYLNTVLPVMTLFELGFGIRGEEVSDEQVKKWYGITQLCQLILPIRFYANHNLKEGQVTLISEEEARQLTNLTESLQIDHQLGFEVSPVKIGNTIVSATDNRVAETVKANLKNRGKIYRRIFKNVVSTMRSELKHRIKSIFISRKTRDNKFVLEEGNHELDQSLEETDKLLNESEDSSELNHRGLSRTKRGTKMELASNIFKIAVVVVGSLFILGIFAFTVFCLIMVIHQG